MTPRDAILRVLQALQKSGTAHLVTGALASNHYGIERWCSEYSITLDRLNELQRSIPLI